MKEEEKFVDLGIRILVNCRNELYRYFPYLDGAFASLTYEASTTGQEETEAAYGTDGEKLFFSPKVLVKNYMKNPSEIKRGYLHILLHCLYFHLFPINEKMDRRIWNLACDMMVELLVEKEIKEHAISTLDIWQDLSEMDEASMNAMDKSVKTDRAVIKKECAEMLGNETLSAEQIYHLLINQTFPYSLKELEEVFAFDSHHIWAGISSGERAARLRKKWKKIASYTTQNKKDGQNRRGSQAGDTEEMSKPGKYSRYDYRRFLKKFAILREEVELDTESFDYIFYHYGLEYYGNLPLIEPLEYKEVNRLEELVIAIDTSGSCSTEMVQRFLAETYRIFEEKENFFRKMKVHILQCDCCLQKAVVIHSDEEWKEYCKNIVIQGRAGTDFRPVFRYVEEQRAKKEIQNLKALIYFTDGDGIFPEKTDYETAFVFVKKCECMNLIPSWITKLFVV